jgi:hypothetical protein
VCVRLPPSSSEGEDPGSSSPLSCGAVCMFIASSLWNGIQSMSAATGSLTSPRSAITSQSDTVSSMLLLAGAGKRAGA